MTRVLVVDDSATTRRVVRKALAASGISAESIREAADGASALEQIAMDAPQLILSDVNMPRMDGFELLEEMGRRGHIGVIPVVMITSRSSMRDRARLIALGAEAVIKKPFPMHALRMYIEPYLVGGQSSVEKREQEHTLDETAAEAVANVTEHREEHFAQALSSSLIATLELSAFLEVIPGQLSPNADASVLYYSALSITRGHLGRLWLAASGDALEQVLGESAVLQGNSVARRADALSELLNTLAGRFCSDLLGEQSDYAFSLPTTDVLLGSDKRLEGGYVFCLPPTNQVVRIGFQSGVL